MHQPVILSFHDESFDQIGAVRHFGSQFPELTRSHPYQGSSNTDEGDDDYNDDDDDYDDDDDDNNDENGHKPMKMFQ